MNDVDTVFYFTPGMNHRHVPNTRQRFDYHQSEPMEIYDVREASRRAFINARCALIVRGQDVDTQCDRRSHGLSCWCALLPKLSLV
ncbi:hypothetical protein CCR75_000954 [Bremia lactucae]|uniref:Uncharacterized protein n=1 Tax=Bremia lactucae TaxID=4779 RepID=A0A976FL11_BRELC|nr:hypothetical protein CCR75_000954 [Bremia lactucae]